MTNRRALTYIIKQVLRERYLINKGGCAMWLKIALVSMLALNLAGCATTTKERMLVQQLEARISKLEADLEQKEKRIWYLENDLERTKSELKRAKEAKAYPARKIAKLSHRQIQIALRNAGFYDGPIDDKIGEKTKKAIKEFQKANALTVDGVVGKKTASKLKKYLE